MTRVLLTGSTGQLGRALLASVPDGVAVTSVTRAQLEFAEATSCNVAPLVQHHDVVLNCAAWTDVAAAERDPNAALRVNGDAVGQLAEGCARHGARLVHVSTDHVFSGAHGMPLAEDAALQPVNAYGRSKAAGEAHVQRLLPAAALVVRTAWLHAPWGQNVVRLFLRVLARDGVLRVTTAEHGNPTSVLTLAPRLWAAALTDATGTLHLTDAGATDRYSLACALRDLAVARGLLQDTVRVEPVPHWDDGVPRPAWAVLDGARAAALLGLPAVPWRDGLAATLDGLADAP